jgi:hypothetical protein
LPRESLGATRYEVEKEKRETRFLRGKGPLIYPETRRPDMSGLIGIHHYRKEAKVCWFK